MTQKVGVDQATILGCFEEQCAYLTPQRKTSPLWNSQGYFANAGDDESEMVGQGLCGSIEAAFEWSTDDARGEESVLDDLSSPCCFVEGAADDQQIVDIKEREYAVAEERYYYYRHDACPNSGRARPPELQDRMGELDHLVVKVAQVHRRLIRCYR